MSCSYGWRLSHLLPKRPSSVISPLSGIREERKTGVWSNCQVDKWHLPTTMGCCSLTVSDGSCIRYLTILRCEPYAIVEVMGVSMLEHRVNWVIMPFIPIPTSWNTIVLWIWCHLLCVALVRFGTSCYGKVSWCSRARIISLYIMYARVSFVASIRRSVSRVWSNQVANCLWALMIISVNFVAIASCLCLVPSIHRDGWSGRCVSIKASF